MNCNELKYRDLINQSKLFELDEETQREAYQDEKRKLLRYLYIYMESLGRINENLGVEFTEEAIRCIKNFDPKKGNDFLKYFESCWNYQFKHKVMNSVMDSDYCGVLSPSEEKILKRFIYNKKVYEEQYPHEHSVEKMYEYLAKVLKVPLEKIEWIAVAENLSILGDNCVTVAGEEFSIWELIDSGVYVEVRQEQLDTIEEYFIFIENAFVEQIEKQKPILSDLLTIRMQAFLKREDIDRFSFVNKDILEEWEGKHKLPTQREIAMKYNRNEASISRMLTTFLNKLKR